MAKEVLLVTGAGQIGLAIVRRMGYGKKIVIATRRPEKARETLTTLTNAGFDAVVIEMDMASRESIVNAVKTAQEFGPIKMLVNAAGVSPSQAAIEQILRVDLLGTAILLEEVRKVIAPGGVGVTISSQSGWRMKQLTPEEDRALAMTPTEELLNLDILQPESIVNTLHAYQLWYGIYT